MNKLGELQKKIETVRKELDVVAEVDVGTEECYRISLRLDRLLEDYMRYTKEKNLRSCGRKRQ